MPAPIDDGPRGDTFASPPLGSAESPAFFPQAAQADTGGDDTQADASLADKAKQKLAGTLGERKNAAADLVDELAQTVRQSGEQFSGKQDWIAGAIGRGAEELSTLAGSLREKDLGGLVREVMAFGERRPALFVGGALATGFAVARVGKLAAADLSRDDLPTMPEVGRG